MAERDNDLQMIRDREGLLGALFRRMDTDRKLYLLEEFLLVDDLGKPLGNVANETMNDAKTFAVRFISDLVSAGMQIEIEGIKSGKPMTDTETHYIEDFLRDILIAVDEYLTNRDIPDLRSYWGEQDSLRGRMAARCLIRMKDGEFIPDVLPWDTRHLLYDTGPNGLLWVAPKTFRTAQQIKAEYGENATKARGTRLEVLDLWKPTTNTVWVSKGKIARPQEQENHNIGYVPWVIQTQGAHTMLDIGYEEFRGESIYEATRKLFTSKSEFASILKTLTTGSFFGALQYESEAGTGAQKPQRPPFALRAVVPVEKGAGFKPMPINDIHNAARLYYSILEAAIQRGSRPSVDYGNLQFPLSAVAISRLTEASNDMLLPRLQALSLAYLKLCRMILLQYTAGNIKAKVGQEGAKTLYDPERLTGEFSIKFRFISTSPEQNIANMAIAAAAEPFFSKDTIRREILHQENPTEERDKMTVEGAVEEHTELRWIHQALTLAEMGREDEAKVIAHKLGFSLRQLKAGVVTPPAERKQEPSRRQVVPLGVGGGRTAGRETPARSAAESAETQAQSEAE